MIDEGVPDLLVAFPGVKRTADMIRRARKAGVTVLVVDGVSEIPLPGTGLLCSEDS